MILTITPFSVMAEENNDFMFNYDGFTVKYTVSEAWNDSQNITVTITNTSDTSIRNWSLKYEPCGTITEIWNAEIYNDNIIKNSGYNSDILPENSITYGYTLTDVSGKPENFALCSHYVEKMDGYDAEFSVITDWENGFVGTIKITNTTDMPIMAWKLSFESNFEIINAHNFSVYENEKKYTIYGTYNGNIPALSYVELTFNGKSTEYPNISELLLMESVIEYYDDKNDGLTDIGEIYFKDIESLDDIEYHNNMSFVRNQLLVTADKSASFDEIKSLAESINASIVGYIELTNDFQIEFNEPVSGEYLEKMINSFSGNLLIDYISLNIISENEAEFAKSEDTTNKYDYKYWGGKTLECEYWHLYDANIFSAWNGDYNNAEIKNYEKLKDVSVKMGIIETYLSSKSNNNLNFVHIWNENSNVPKYIENKKNTEEMKEIKKQNHGIHVAGIMSGKINESICDHSGNLIKAAGVYPGSKLYGFAMNGDSDLKIGEKSVSTVMEHKIAYALLIGNNVRVINVSMGIDNPVIDNIKSGAAALEFFLNRLIAEGYDFVIESAAGNVKENKNGENTGLEAKYSSYINYIRLSETSNNSSPIVNRILVVGNMKKNGEVHSKCYSGFDILAPGDSIYSTGSENIYFEYTGSSMATPIVSGIAGMLYELFPNISAEQVQQAILQSENKKDNEKNKGVDAKKAIENAAKLTGTPYEEKEKVIITGNIAINKNNTNILNKYYSKIKVNIYNSENRTDPIATSDIYPEGKKAIYEYVFSIDKDKVKIDDKGNANLIFEIVSNMGKSEVKYQTNNNRIDKKDLFDDNVFIWNIDTYMSMTKQSNGKKLEGTSVKIEKIFTDGEGSASSKNVTAEAITDENGDFIMDASDGKYLMTFTKENYQNLEMIIEIKDGIMYYNDEEIDSFILTPIESEIKGTVTAFNSKTEEIRPLENFEVLIYPADETGKIVGEAIAKGITSVYGTYNITLEQHGSYILFFSQDKQTLLTVSGGEYQFDVQFIIEDDDNDDNDDKDESKDDGDDKDDTDDNNWVIDENKDIIINFDGTENTNYTGDHSGDLLGDGIWFKITDGTNDYYARIYIEEGSGQYKSTIGSPGWGLYTSTYSYWTNQLRSATYRSDGKLISDQSLGYFYNKTYVHIPESYRHADETDSRPLMKIEAITSIKITVDGIVYNMHTDGYYKETSNLLGSVGIRKEEWTEDKPCTWSFYRNCKLIGASTQKPF